jgi:hypothetical protein
VTWATMVVPFGRRYGRVQDVLIFLFYLYIEVKGKEEEREGG